jgi:hypothetical protein
MKTKIFILLAASAIVTLSFTFVTVRGKEAHRQPTTTTTAPAHTTAPAGGFAMEDQAF